MSTDASAASRGSLSESPANLALGIDGFTWGDLHRAERLPRLSEAFLDHFRSADGELAAEWETYCGAPAKLESAKESRLLIDVSRHLSQFLAKLFRGS